MLSAGQKMMVALIGDIAIKAVTQNAYLLPPDALGEEDKPWPRVLRETPGLVLIDEVDVHLHPKWQRRVIDDLKATFPEIQFVSTSHSPFIIQSLAPGQLRMIGDTAPPLVEYTNRSIDDIAEEIQDVNVPQMSEKAKQFADATERYFSLLQQPAEAETSSLHDAEAEYRKAAERFSANPGLSAVTNCNSVKGDKDVADDETLWPDRDNAMIAIEYSKGGFVRVVDSLDPPIKTMARKLVTLIGLDRHGAREWPNPATRDRRWLQRDEVWAEAEKLLDIYKDLGASEAVKKLVIDVAKGYGFFSIWIELFSDHPEILHGLIESFPGTAANCFDPDGSPINRPNGVI